MRRRRPIHAISVVALMVMCATVLHLSVRDETHWPATELRKTTARVLAPGNTERSTECQIFTSLMEPVAEPVSWWHQYTIMYHRDAVESVIPLETRHGMMEPLMPPQLHPENRKFLTAALTVRKQHLQTQHSDARRVMGSFIALYGPHQPAPQSTCGDGARVPPATHAFCTALENVMHERHTGPRGPAPATAIPPAYLFPSGQRLEVDVVITYVNGSLPGWRRSARERSPHEFDMTRFRDWNELLYAMRSVYWHGGMCDGPEVPTTPGSCTTWLRHVFVVVADDTHVPRWLNRSHARVRIVTHAQLVGAAEAPRFLPTFNSNAIETLLHRIPGVSRYFLYLNNDMLLGRPLSLFDLFRPVPAARVFGSLRSHMCRQGRRPVMYLEPILYAERMESADQCTTVPLLNASRRPALQCRTDGWPFSEFYSFNRRLVYDRLGMFPSYTFAHVPRLFDRDVLEEMVEVAFSDVTYQTRSRPMRTRMDLWVPFAYMYYAQYKREEYQRHVDASTVRPPEVRDTWWSFSLPMMLRYVLHGESPTFALVYLTLDTSIFLLDGTDLYYFGIIRGKPDVVRVQKDLEHRKKLFITINDNIDIPLMSVADEYMSGRGGDVGYHYVEAFKNIYAAYQMMFDSVLGTGSVMPDPPWEFVPR